MSRKIADVPAGPARGKRTFTWFEPQGQRATEYELYTVGQMSSPQEWLRVGWPVRFDDGREPYVTESTKICSSHWRDWRDPAGVWQRPYVQVTNFDEQALDRLVPEAFTLAELASNRRWLHEVIGAYYAAWPFADYGLFSPGYDNLALVSEKFCRIDPGFAIVKQG